MSVLRIPSQNSSCNKVTFTGLKRKSSFVYQISIVWIGGSKVVHSPLLLLGLRFVLPWTVVSQLAVNECALINLGAMYLPQTSWRPSLTVSGMYGFTYCNLRLVTWLCLSLGSQAFFNYAVSCNISNRHHREMYQITQLFGQHAVRNLLVAAQMLI